MDTLNAKKKNALKWTLLAIALTNMPSLALSPATEQIRQFFNVELATVQTAMSSTNIVQMCVALLMMYLINKGIITKKLAVVLGQSLFVVVVVFVLLFHDGMWTVWVLSWLIGIACGCFVTNAFGIMFDCFTDAERQSFAGLQTSSINLGGILMSLAGGLLAGLFWYGGYLVFVVGIIMAIIGVLNIPSYKTPKEKQDGKRVPIKKPVFFYAVAQLVFMMCYIAVGQNLSSHLRSGGFENFSFVAGICTSVQMAGGVCAGLFFSKLSRKLGDDIMVLSTCLLFAGMLLLSFVQSSVPLALIAVFLCGGSLSTFNPWCTYGVSVYSEPANSAITSVIISAIAPSIGGFFSPVVFTNVTDAIRVGSTAFRYRFVAIFVLVFAACLFLYNRTHKGASAKAK